MPSKDPYQEENESKLAYELKHNPAAYTQKVLDSIRGNFTETDAHNFCSQIRDFLDGKLIITDLHKFKSALLNAGALMGLAAAGYLKAKE